jgi:hypothetical protein
MTAGAFEVRLASNLETRLLTRLQRAPHDIENQLIFRSNPRMIFHVSRGFESGSGEEMEKVKNFIAKRATSSSPAERLHVIW